MAWKPPMASINLHLGFTMSPHENHVYRTAISFHRPQFKAAARRVQYAAFCIRMSVRCITGRAVSIEANAACKKTRTHIDYFCMLNIFNSKFAYFIFMCFAVVCRMFAVAFYLFYMLTFFVQFDFGLYLCGFLCARHPLNRRTKQKLSHAFNII